MLKTIFRFIFGKGLIFLLGLLVGLAIFTPWDRVWEKGLGKLNEENKDVALLWEGIEDASFTGAKIKGFNLRWPKDRIQADSLEFRLGLLKPLKATIETGPEKLNLAMSWGKTLDLLGSVEVGTFLALSRTAGKMAVDGEISWDDLASPPVSGTLALNSPSLTWEGKTTLEDFAFEASLNQTLLNLNSVRFVKPLPVNISGNLELNWSQLGQSQGEVDGTVEMGGKQQNFSKKGTLNNLLKQAGM